MKLAFLLTLGGAGGDGWIGVDKVKHFFAAAFVQSFGYSALRAAGADHQGSLAGATVATGAASVAKELGDRRTKGVFSRGDLLWDAAGAGASTLLLQHTTR